MAQRLLGALRGRAGDAARPRPRHLSVRDLVLRDRGRAPPPGLGIPPTRIDGVLGIAKAYTTRVGAGPLPSEIGGALEDDDPRARQRVRRHHRPPAALRLVRRRGRRATRVRVNGFDSLALTKLDVLDELAEIKVCTAYRYEGETLDDFPRDLSCSRAASRSTRRCPAGRRPPDGVRDFECPARRPRALRRAAVRARRRSRSASSPPAPTAPTRSSAARAPSRPGSTDAPACPRAEGR